MKQAYVFPGQGSQYPGMGKELYDSNELAREFFEQANDILGFRITDIMFEGEAEDLLQTHVTQPAVFLHSVVVSLCSNIHPDMAAGHSLGEFSALAAAGVLSLEDALHLVSVRADAMQKCCEKVKGGMAAIIAPAQQVEDLLKGVDGIVVPANYNNDMQTVISGEDNAVDNAIEVIKAAGIRKAIKLKVGGAFHSPLMEPARTELAEAISKVHFSNPVCPVYQNVDSLPHINPEEIKTNLLMQLTSPVLWTQTVRNMITDGATSFVEVGPGKVLRGLISKIAPDMELSAME